jgi:hypothetical protein
MGLFIYLTPFIPLSMIWICNSLHEGEIEVFEGAKPLQTSRDKQPLNLGIGKRGFT